MKKHVIIAVTNDLTTDQRINRVAHTLSQNGYIVMLVGHVFNKNNIFNTQYNYTRFNLPFKTGPLFYLCYNIRLFFFILNTKYDIIVANDTDLLTGAYCANLLKRKRLVFDSHELFTELPELVNKPFNKFIWKTVEHCFIPHLKNCYTVCQSLANIYSKKYGVPFNVIRNVPFFEPKPTVPFYGRKPIIMYQGAINMGRGIELMIETMQYLPNAQLWIAGNGYLIDKIKKTVSQKAYANQIVFLGQIHINQLKFYTQQARVGLTIEEDLGLNYHYALPNKLFDYIQARVPVIVANLPEMKNIVDNYKVGYTITERSPIILASRIKQVLNMPVEQAELMEQNLEKAAQLLCWENESEKLLQIYSSII